MRPPPTTAWLGGGETAAGLQAIRRSPPAVSTCTSPRARLGSLSLSLDVERPADRSQGTSETVRVLLGGHTTMLAASLQAGESPDRGQRARWGGWLDFSEYRGRHQYISWTRREHPACPIDLCGGCSTSRVD
jgi:hypothetical protein